MAGIQRGSKWQALLTDNDVSPAKLRIPQPGHSFAYPISTVDNGTYGTLQIESAPLVVRYPDTAYQAHGNYGVEYNLHLPLYNDSSEERIVTIAFQTPIKTNIKSEVLSFFEPPEKRIFFRGTIALKYNDDKGRSKRRYVHLVERRGQASEPLVKFVLKPKATRSIEVTLFYPPDATPPQVLTVSTEAK